MGFGDMQQKKDAPAQAAPKKRAKASELDKPNRKKIAAEEEHEAQKHDPASAPARRSSSLAKTSSRPNGAEAPRLDVVAPEAVHVEAGVVPKDYHCACARCKKAIGELVRADGTHYSRNDRRIYYSPEERASTSVPTGHIAKTPLHVARWAVQTYTKKGDWVLDPTAGAGTTMVEALVLGRNAVGVEIQTIDVLKANCGHVLAQPLAARPHAAFCAIHGDARALKKLLDAAGAKERFSLVVNNPPYWGDQSQKGQGAKMYRYDETRENLAFLKEGPEYYEALASIYAQCVERMKPGARFVLGIKDQMRDRAPDMLHQKIGDVLEKLGLEHEGTAFLLHYPATLHLNTYEKRTGVKPPLYQTIVVFKKR